MVSGEDGDPPTTPSGQLQIPFGILTNGFIQVTQTPLLPIHPNIPPWFTPLLQLGGICSDIQTPPPPPTHWAGRRRGPHRSALMYRSYWLQYGWCMGSHFQSSSHPRWCYWGRHWSLHPYWPPSGLEGFLLISASSGTKRGPTPGVTRWMKYHPFWSDIVRLEYASWQKDIVNLDRHCTPANQVYILSSTLLCLAS